MKKISLCVLTNSVIRNGSDTFHWAIYMGLILRNRKNNPQTMGNVQLIVTGKMEENGLATALKNAFPELSFPQAQRLDGFTSVRIRQGLIKTPAGILRQVDKLSNALIAAVDPGRTGKPADMAIAIDDLELENIHQADVVVSYFKDAVEKCVRNRWQKQDRQEKCFQKVRGRCSFHLLVPMAEAYFFGEPDAIRRAGAKKKSMVSGKYLDVEEFLVSNDADYLKASSDKYWAKDQRERHPKCYLQYLCDPSGTEKRKNRYRETHGGVNALKTLNWGMVLRNRGYVKFIRSLFDDISDRFGLSNPYPGNCDPITSNGKNSVLRNA